MEELGIGRPSTYAADRHDPHRPRLCGNRQAQAGAAGEGRLVTAFLESFFTRYVEYDFTASLEEKLDQISAGELNWKGRAARLLEGLLLQIEDTKELRVTNVLDALNEGIGTLVFPKREDGGDRAFVRSAHRQTVPETRKVRRFRRMLPTTRNATTRGNSPPTAAVTPKQPQRTSRKASAKDPHTWRGDHAAQRPASAPMSSAATARRRSVPACRRAGRLQRIDHEKALALLSLPRDIGPHPESGKMISTASAVWPFVLHNGTYANLESVEDVFSIGLNRAISVLADKQSKAPAAVALPRRPSRSLGNIRTAGAITVRDGTLRTLCQLGQGECHAAEGKDPQSVTVEEALALIAEREAKGGVTKGKAAKENRPQESRQERSLPRLHRPEPRKRRSRNQQRRRKRKRPRRPRRTDFDQDSARPDRNARKGRRQEVRRAARTAPAGERRRSFTASFLPARC